MTITNLIVQPLTWFKTPQFFHSNVNIRVLMWNQDVAAAKRDVHSIIHNKNIIKKQVNRRPNWKLAENASLTAVNSSLESGSNGSLRTS